MNRIRTTVALAATLALAVVAAPAAAHAKHKSKPEPKYTYTATIDCGSGPVVVASTDEMFAPLLNRKTGKQYFPVKWNVKVGEHVIKQTKPGFHRGRTATCSYDDGQAVGTVTVLRAKRAKHHSRHHR
jgi:hypothetical protein